MVSQEQINAAIKNYFNHIDATQSHSNHSISGDPNHDPNVQISEVGILHNNIPSEHPSMLGRSRSNSLANSQHSNKPQDLATGHSVAQTSIPYHAADHFVAKASKPHNSTGHSVPQLYIPHHLTSHSATQSNIPQHALGRSVTNSNMPHHPAGLSVTKSI